MYVDNAQKYKNNTKRQSYSSTRSKPLEYIYHNPILQSSKKHKQVPASSIVKKDLLVKVLDLKLPVIHVPRLINRFIQKGSKFFRVQRPQIRCKSIIPELLVTSNNSVQG